MPDGSPQLTETWADTDGEHVLLNIVEGLQKARNLRRDPRVAERRAPQRRVAERRVAQATNGGVPDSLTIGRPADSQPCIPSDTLVTFQPLAPSTWAARADRLPARQMT